MAPGQGSGRPRSRGWRAPALGCLPAHLRLAHPLTQSSGDPPLALSVPRALLEIWFPPTRLLGTHVHTHTPGRCEQVSPQTLRANQQRPLKSQNASPGPHSGLSPARCCSLPGPLQAFCVPAGLFPTTRDPGATRPSCLPWPAHAAAHASRSAFCTKAADACPRGTASQAASSERHHPPPGPPLGKIQGAGEKGTQAGWPVGPGSQPQGQEHSAAVLPRVRDCTVPPGSQAGGEK